jgi:hypothetical protein
MTTCACLWDSTRQPNAPEGRSLSGTCNQTKTFKHPVFFCSTGNCGLHFLDACPRVWDPQLRFTSDAQRYSALYNRIKHPQSSCPCMGDNKITPQGHTCIILHWLAHNEYINSHMFRRNLTDSSEISIRPQLFRRIIMKKVRTFRRRGRRNRGDLDSIYYIESTAQGYAGVAKHSRITVSNL